MNEHNKNSGIDVSKIYWDNIQNKPSEYPVEHHTHSEYAKRYHKHSVEDISDLGDVASADHVHDDRYYTKEEIETKIDSIDITVETNWNDILNKPTQFPPTSHIHDEFYTREEINSILQNYATLGHTHTVDDIEGLDQLPGGGGDGGNNGGNDGNTSAQEAYTRFIILKEFWTKTTDGLYSCLIDHGFNTKNIDAIARYNNGAYALVDIDAIHVDEVMLTAIDDEPLVLFVKKITIK